jgi:hypothetical protein
MISRFSQIKSNGKRKKSAVRERRWMAKKRGGWRRRRCYRSEFEPNALLVGPSITFKIALAVAAQESAYEK